MNAIEIVEKKLVGNFYSRFSLGDTFDLFFNDFWLITQNITCLDEEKINSALSKYSPIQHAIDAEDVAKAVILTATKRKKVTQVTLNPDASLQLNFENGVALLFTTDTDIVDWQWAINKNAKDPYGEFMLGVFTSKEVEIHPSFKNH